MKVDPSSLELLLLFKLNATMGDFNTVHEIRLAQQRRVPILGGGGASTSSSSGFGTPSTTTSFLNPDNSDNA